MNSAQPAIDSNDYKNSSHSFNVQDAIKYGVDCAVLLQHFRFWIFQNKRMGRNFHEGKTWMYQTQKEIASIYPYWSEDKVGRIITKLEDLGAIIKANFNKFKFDQTSWYALTEESTDSGDPLIKEDSNKEFDSAKLRNPNRESAAPSFRKTAEPIPDTKKDTKTESISDSALSVKEAPDKNHMNRKSPLSFQEKEEEFSIVDALAFCESVGLSIKRKDFEIWSKKHSSNLIYSTLNLLLDESKNPKSGIFSHAKYMQKALDDNWTQQRKNMETNSEYAKKMKKEYLWPDLVITKQYCRDERLCIDWSFNKDPEQFKNEFDLYIAKRIEAHNARKEKNYV